MSIRSHTETTTGSLEDIRRFLGDRFDTSIVIEQKADKLWEWAAKRGSHWGRIIPDEPHQFTRAASNVVGFALTTKRAFIVEVSSYE